MSESPVLLEKKGHVAWVLLNRPEAENKINPALIQALDEVFVELATDDAVRVVALAGVGPVFCAGADVGALGSFESYETRARFGQRMHRTSLVFQRIERLPKPVIAAVNGVAQAGGLELMLCCDLAVAGRTARFGDAHSPHGQLPGGGASIRLPRRIGATRAKYVLYMGAMIEAQTMLEWGAINEVVDDDRLLEATQALADQLAAISPSSLARLKRLIDDGLNQPLETALRLEILAAELNMGSDDMSEGLRALQEGRTPRFTRG
ncbi:MAG TPA: enoyl-CoA hydratase/isomerase family protein [Candidatus Nitrosotalea sp.]|nr:enoyl-CoA hydratase/isomerase family protein [Candidatus Nitrosotalea sp.]